MADLPRAGEIWERKISGTRDEFSQVRISDIDIRYVYKTPMKYGRESRQLIHHFLRQYRKLAL